MSDLYEVVITDDEDQLVCQPVTFVSKADAFEHALYMNDQGLGYVNVWVVKGARIDRREWQM
jgi:hypothetical protein